MTPPSGACYPGAMHLAFVLAEPPGAGPVAAFVRGIAGALRGLGHTVDVAIDAGSIPPGARPVLDGMALPALVAGLDELAGRGAIALIHHPGAAVTESAGDLERAWLPRFGRVVATSRPVADRLAAEFGVAEKRLAVVTPGAPDAARSPGSGGGCAVLAVGALAPRKGHDALLRAFSGLPDLDWRLTIAGSTRDPAHAATLAELVGGAGLAGRVRIAADPEPDALEALWRGADLFALATRWEGYPAAVAEALRRGLPVATTEAGAGLLPAGGGTSCPADDAAALSKCLRRMIFDTSLRAAMADAAWAAGRALPGWPEQAALFIESVREP